MIFRMMLATQLVETDPEVASKAAREAQDEVIDACRRGEADAFAALLPSAIPESVEAPAKYLMA